jgi:chromate transporter
VLAVDPGRAERFARSARFWLLPVGGVYGDVAWFFSKMAIVTFGGAYAVLVYAAEKVVQGYHWLSAPEMLSGLGLAETTPGPLILVLQFVGFLAGYSAPGNLWGVPGGVVASVLTLWVTFLPCFAFVFLGAPLVEGPQENRKLAGALSAVTAAVVSVVANLATWFALHVLFHQTLPVRAFGMSFDAPSFDSIDPWALALAVVAGMHRALFPPGKV